MSTQLSNEKLFLKSLQTALDLSQECLRLIDREEIETVLQVLENRSRVINIVLHLNEQTRLSNNFTLPEINLVNQLLEAINKMDEDIELKLDEQKMKTQGELATNHTNKEKHNGYNLRKVK